MNSLLSISAFKYSGANSLLILTTNKCLQANYAFGDDNLTDNILHNSNLAVVLQNIYPGANSLLALATDKCLQTNCASINDNLTDNILYNSDLAVAL